LLATERALARTAATAADGSEVGANAWIHTKA
jgi:hypothetical protein